MAFVEVTRPLGWVDDTVVDPHQFDVFADLVLDGLRWDPPGTLREVYEEFDALVERHEEEPDDPGFFAFGAVVELLYASEFLFGEERAAASTFMRASDLLGFLDDSLGTALHDRLIDWVVKALGGERGPADGLRDDVELAARALPGSSLSHSAAADHRRHEPPAAGGDRRSP